jgi:hypothetical protein
MNCDPSHDTSFLVARTVAISSTRVPGGARRDCGVIQRRRRRAGVHEQARCAIPNTSRPKRDGGRPAVDTRRLDQYQHGTIPRAGHAIPLTVQLSFYRGAAAFFGAVLWTILQTK